MTEIVIGYRYKRWVLAKDCEKDPRCLANTDAGWIRDHRAFPTGVQQPPAHPDCQCDIEYLFTPRTLPPIYIDFKHLKRWVTKEDRRVCKICRRNEDEGWILASLPFPSGHLWPPAHPNCRCHIMRGWSPSERKPRW